MLVAFFTEICVARPGHLDTGVAFQKRYMGLPINDSLVRREPSLVALRMQGNLGEHELN